MIEYHHGRQDLPIFLHQKRRPSSSEAINILLDPDLDRKRVCSSQPTAIDKNAVFIINLKKLRHPSDVLCDDMGTWVCSGCRRSWVCIDEEGCVDSFHKEEPSTGNCYQVIREYYNNKVSSDFHRTAIFLEGMSVTIMWIAIIFNNAAVLKS